MRSPPIFLFTDFGSADVYVGQVKAVLHEAAPESPAIDLLNDAPNFRVEASAHLLAALAAQLPRGAVTVAVVDPGVGSERAAVALEADGRWYVGPDNGLLSVLAARAAAARAYALSARSQDASVSFHGRDIFAPAAARLARGDRSVLEASQALTTALDAGDHAQVIYIDHYGNVMTGLRATAAQEQQALGAGAHIVPHARVFSAVAPASLFWYVNSIGLIEIAANQASAAALLSAVVGMPVLLR